MTDATHNKGFDSVIKHLKGGYRGATATRNGWNGKDMYIYLFDSMLPNHLPQINMHTADGKEVAWLASQSDMLANDWTIRF